MKRLPACSIRGYIDANRITLLINQRGEFIYRWNFMRSPRHLGQMKYHPVNHIYHNSVVLDLWGIVVYNIGEI